MKKGNRRQDRKQKGRTWISMGLALTMGLMVLGAAARNEGSIFPQRLPVYAQNAQPDAKEGVTDPDAETGAEKTQPAVDLLGSKEGYTAVLYDNMNGLPTSEANDIAETEEGFIWIGSYSGLIRYDGNTFERIDSTTGIASVVCLYVDSKGQMWIGTNDSGVAVMGKGSLRFYNKEDGLKSLSVRSVVEDLNGNIYIATTHGIAIVDENGEMRQMDEPQINEEYIQTLNRGSDGIIYGLTKDGAFLSISDGKIQTYQEGEKLGIEDIHSIYPDQANPGRLYLGTKKSEIYYGQLDRGVKGMKKIDVSPLEYINRVEVIGEQLWVCADNGIGIVKDGTFTQLHNLPANNSIEKVKMDYQGNLWFASSKQGVMKIVPSQFTNIFEQYKLPETVINSTCTYQGKLFAGGKNDGLTVIGEDGVEESVPVKTAKTASGKELQVTDLLQMLEGSRIRSIIKDSKNRLWISTFGENCLLRYDDGELLQFTQEDGLPSDQIRTVFERKDGTFMVACSGGMALIDGDKVTEVYNEDSGISNTSVLTVAEAENGDMLIGTDGEGIYVIKDSGVTHLGTSDSELKSDVIMRIRKDRQRNLFWIVTSNSIAYMDSDYKITTLEHFPYSNNFDLYENSRDEMWILSSNGIYAAPTKELLANGEIEPVFYGIANGLPCITTANSYSDLTEEGELYIAGTTGVAKVNIDKTSENVSEVKMAVPYVEADGVRTYPDASGTITIPAGTKKLTIYDYVYTYSLMNPKVTCWLEGFEQEKTTVRRSELVPVDYTNLRGGTYYFQMQLKDSMGHGNKEMSVRIVKKKAYYERGWFYLVCALLLGFAIALLVQFILHKKTKALLKKEQENKLLIREIVEAFAKTIDMKDNYTNGHSTRVAEYTSMLAKEMGCDEETIEKYYNIALLHDIGKIGVPMEVLNKPGKLTDEEFAIIKSHPAQGENVLKDISIMPELAIGAGAHHERPDGKGYPRGLTEEKIPQVARIIGVADTFDAMYSNRPYRKRMNFEKVVSIIKEAAGTQLSSEVVDAFLRLVDKGEFRAPDDHGGGTMEDINNIHKKFEKEAEGKTS